MTEKLYRDENWLVRMYHHQGLSQREIAKRCSGSHDTVRRWMDRYDIEARDYSEAVSQSWEGDDERREHQAEIMMTEVQPKAPQIEDGKHRPATIEKMSKVKMGDENPMWQGGYEGEYGHTWPRKRKAALERDGYECQACGSDEELHVHHHRPVRTFENPNDAHFLENLVTVCVECHPTQERLSRRHTFVRDVQI